jgi:hypothetical protein
MTTMSHDDEPARGPLPEDPLQRALVLRLREEGNAMEVARKIRRARGYPDTDARALLNIRRQVGRWISGDNPDVPLSTVTELARALGDDPLRILGYDRTRRVRAVADAAEAAARGKRRAR